MTATVSSEVPAAKSTHRHLRSAAEIASECAPRSAINRETLSVTAEITQRDTLNRPYRGDLIERLHALSAHIPKLDLSPANKSAEKELDEILAPLVELLDEKYRQTDDCDPFVLIEISGGQTYRVDSPYLDGVLIELPPRLRDCKPLASIVATLLQRSGSDVHWFDDADGEEDPYRTPLRFCFVKKVVWMPGDSCLSEGGHLMVDAISFDAAAAERQVGLLVEYLKDETNLVEPGADDLMMF